MKWYENKNESADTFYNLEIEDPDGGFKNRGTYDSLEKAKKNGERLRQYYGRNYKIRISPVPNIVWRSWQG